MHRTIIAALAAVLVTSFAHAEPAGQSSVGQSGVDRPGGTYVELPSASAAACAAQCARDGLCLAWSYRPATANACALKAVVTPPQNVTGAASGLAPRAPGFAALVGVAAKPPEAPPQRVAVLAPAPIALRPQLPAPAAPPVEPKKAAPAAAAQPAQEEELLGGPDDI